jgi:hypothetical protein
MNHNWYVETWRSGLMVSRTRITMGKETAVLIRDALAETESRMWQPTSTAPHYMITSSGL